VVLLVDAIELKMTSLFMPYIYVNLTTSIGFFLIKLNKKKKSHVNRVRIVMIKT
jgi:hypothetical protein